MAHIMKTSIRLLVIGTLLVGCAAPSEDPNSSGTDSTRGSGGKPSTSKPSGSGGSVGSGSGGSAAGGSSATGSGGAQASGGASGTSSGGASGGDQDAAAGAGGAPVVADAGGDAGGPVTADPVPGAAPYGCTGCTRAFDGKTLNGWHTAPGSWVVKEGGIMASTGKNGDIYTAEDLGDYRIFFQVKHGPAMGGKDHQPCTTLFGKRPASPTAVGRGLGGAQFQPPNGYSWDYGAGGKFTSPAGKPKMDAKVWNQCEIVVKEAGSFKAACCTMGATPCKTALVLSWTGTGRKHPFNFMMHNPGLFDEYREIWIEKNPTDDSFLSQK
jgi:hypothetical protein